MDDNKLNNDTANVSDIRTSQVCNPSDHHPSSDTHHNSTCIEGSTNLPTVESDYEKFIQFY